MCALCIAYVRHTNGPEMALFALYLHEIRSDSKKKEGINPPFNGGYKAPNHLVVWLHSRGDFFRFRSIVDFRMMAVIHDLLLMKKDQS